MAVGNNCYKFFLLAEELTGARHVTRAALHSKALALQHELPGSVRLWPIVDRMRCHRCGMRPVGMEVKPP